MSSEWNEDERLRRLGVSIPRNRRHSVYSREGGMTITFSGSSEYTSDVSNWTYFSPTSDAGTTTNSSGA